MELILISMLAAVIGIGGGLAFARGRTKGTRWMIWGVVTMFIFSWSVCTCVGGVAVLVTNEALAVVPFWIYGIPVAIVIGFCMVIYGLYIRMRKTG